MWFATNRILYKKQNMHNLQHDDVNCFIGQNKNHWLLWYFVWRVLNDMNNKITYSFMLGII